MLLAVRDSCVVRGRSRSAACVLANGAASRRQNSALAAISRITSGREKRAQKTLAKQKSELFLVGFHFCLANLYRLESGAARRCAGYRAPT